MGHTKSWSGGQPWGAVGTWDTKSHGVEDSTGHMGHTKYQRARGGGALPVGSFQGRSLGWRLERWETGWQATLRSCGIAELVPVMTDSSCFTDSCTGPTDLGQMRGPSTMDATQVVSGL